MANYRINYSVWFQEGILWFASISLYGTCRYKLKTGAITKWLPLSDVNRIIKVMHRAYPYDYGTIQLYHSQLMDFRKELFTAWLSVLPLIRQNEDTEQMNKHIYRVEKKLREALERYNEENE